MLKVKTPRQALEMVQKHFGDLGRTEIVSIGEACGRILAEDICSCEYVPDFNRSTVDGYAVRARDTFGCSDSMPALLTLAGQVLMGESASVEVQEDTCVAVPTGGEVPSGADAVVMMEYTEDYGDGTIGILKAAAPGSNMIFRGDDVKPGQVVLKKGQKLTPQCIGALAAMGAARVPVAEKLQVGIISTGDELVSVSEIPGPGQIRDVNSDMLKAAVCQAGCQAVSYGMICDQEALLEKTISKASKECDVILISGGSSVGAKDVTSRLIEAQGEILFHGIAMKPGKPTILGKINEKPVIGLPGHPAAAFFVAQFLVYPLLECLTGCRREKYGVKALLTESVEANHGREQYMGVKLERQGDRLWAKPIRSKSGLIASLADAHGYFCIARDCEGMAKGTEIDVMMYE